ncbi:MULTISPECIES: autotransporter domain-containing protein [unclassified Anaerobiospirillum]|uniref:autotransporter domain-containing protein n=1 Tax=unclassified Anaerobiospirillum TaxID=2647410 RepID=UPI001FF12D07|nr:MULTISPECIES: autotransporter domain-containing protein [unclassified Anaerobiospirillum]MCK0535092.1 autotransporter domain-containing protein [Anaerobiospirillum sp. NML120511]MCK0540265.1 autotransporter domain-containing protein [Anaerobiospirillum sp. NML02-A-032]
MKLSNNAIKFLMAQYRAIYKNAYFKGIASAVVLTSVMAAGQAQAASLEAATDLSTVGSEIDTLTIIGTGSATAQGTFDNISIQDDASSSSIKNYNIKITSGAAGTNNKVEGAATNKNGALVAKNLLIESTGDNTVGLGVAGNNNGTGTATFETINIIKGTLSASGDTKSGSVFAGKITVGGENSAAAGDAVLQIKDLGVVGKALTTVSKLSDGTQVTLGNNAKLDAAKKTGGASNATLNAAVLTIDGGSIVTNGNNTDKSGLTINLVNGSMSAGAIEIASGDTLTVNFAGDANTIDDLDASGNKVENATAKADRTFNITGGSLSLKGATTVSGNGTLAIGDSVQYSGETAGVALTVSGSAANTPATLKVSGSKLKEIAAASKLTTENAVVQLTDDNYDLGNLGLTLDAATADLNKWAAKDASTIKGNNLTVSADLANGTNLTVEAANKLTLGKTSSAAVDISGVAGFKAKDVEFISHNGTDAFTLKKGLELSSVSADGKTAQTGTIEGAVTVSGAVTINGGNYSSKDSVKVSGAAVTASGAAVDSTLTLNGDVVITAAAASKFVANGAKAVIDLTKVKSIAMSGSTAVAGLNASNNGTIKIKGEDFTSLLNTTGATDKLLATLESDGKLHTTGSLTIAKDKLGTSATAGIKTTKGTLVAEELIITGAQAGVELGTSGNIVAQTLTVNGNAAADSVLKSGNYTVLNELSVATGTGLTVSGASAVLNLGKINAVEGKTGVYAAASEGGTVSSNVLISGDATTKVNLDSGLWTLSGNLTNTAGALTIGAATEQKDASGNAIEAGLTVTGKFTNTSGSTVKKWGSLTTLDTELQTGGKLTVDGIYTLNGKYNDGGTPKDDSDDTFGIKLASGTVDLNGTMSLGADAMRIFTVDKNGDVTVATDTIADAAITSNVGSTLVLNFAAEEGAEKVALSTTGLDSIKDLLAANVGGTITLNGASIKELTVDAATNTVKYEDAKKVQDYLGDYIDPAVQQATLTGVTSSDKVIGHFGAIKSNDSGLSTDSSNVGISKKAGFYNAISKTNSDGKKYFALGQNDAVLGFSVDAKSQLTLANGGVTSQVKLGNDSYLFIDSNNGVTEILNNISGTAAEVQVRSGKTSVAGAVNVGTLGVATGADLSAGGNVSAKKLALTAGSALSVNGNLTQSAADMPVLMDGKLDVAGTASFAGEVTATGNINVKGDATFSKVANLTGADNQFKAVSFNDEANFTKGVTKAEKITIVNASKPLNVSAGGSLVAGELNAKDDTTVIQAGTIGNKADKTPGSTGYISVGTLNLNGGKLVADPEFGTSAASVIAVKQLGSGAGNQGFAAGTLNGVVYALQNSIVTLGSDNITAVQNTFGQYFDNVGSLKSNDIGAIAYVADEIKVDSGSNIVIDSNANDDNASGSTTGYNTNAKLTAYNGADLYIGNNSVLAVSTAAYDKGAAVTFNKSGAATIKVANKDTSKVVIASEGINAMSDIQLFANTDAAGVKLDATGANELKVETMNGLFSYTLDNTSLSSKFNLNLNANKAEKAFANISQPVRDTIITYAYGAHNPGAREVAEGAAAQDPVYLVGERYSQFAVDESGAIHLVNEKGEIDTNLDAKVDQALKDAGLRDDKGNDYWTTDFNKAVFRKAENKLLAHVLSSLNGVDAETAARLADFGGVAQAALRAGNTTSDAIAARMGVGVNGTVTFAANGQGSGMWVTPVYKTADSDSFGADGVNYGTDMNLYGVAVGADVSVMENVSAGVMFNVGSGDADGQGLGSNVKNDFDYYGFGAYMGYTMGAASVVADVSWTTVDNSVEGQTGLGTLAASIDSSALSLGVTGKYAMDFGGVNVTPHAGLRFTRIDQDDYAVGNGTDVFAQYSSNSMNVFSVPVGVTVEKEYTFDAWSVKPAFDLTLTGNFGDDETSGTVDWEGISNLSTDIKSEFVDTFTYSTAIGVAAQTGNFGMGLGVNYTGASNVKEFGVNANVRYVF